jgi:3-deoxy-D-manno-octulosonate 8-phosphate phosphatase (KDO 8-P phosphatase)
MGIADVFKGCKDKAAALREFAARRELALTEVCFVGDDVNDLGAIALAGYSAAPADAHPAVRSVVTRVTTQAGGHGAVREVIDELLAARGRGE